MNRTCNICGRSIDDLPGYFHYCVICREKIQRGEIEANNSATTQFIRDRERVLNRQYFHYRRRREERRQREGFHCVRCMTPLSPSLPDHTRYCPSCKNEMDKIHAMKHARKIRYARYSELRSQGQLCCYFCGSSIPEKRRKKCSKDHPPKFCQRSCFTADLREANIISGYFYQLSRAGNQALEKATKKNGYRPGYEKRRSHMLKLQEERKAGRPWGKTGRKPLK